MIRRPAHVDRNESHNPTSSFERNFIFIMGAGVAVTGMEKFDFIWYLRKIAFWALTGYFAGFVTYWAM